MVTITGSWAYTFQYDSSPVWDESGDRVSTDDSWSNYETCWIKYDVSAVKTGYTHQLTIPHRIQNNSYPMTVDVYEVASYPANLLDINDHTDYTLGDKIGEFYCSSESTTSVNFDITDIVANTTGTYLIITLRYHGSTSANFRRCWISENATYITATAADQYYVNSSTGNDSNTGLSAGSAWLTMDHAAKSTPTNCTLNIVGSFTDEPASNQIHPTNSGVTYVWTSEVIVENNN